MRADSLPLVRLGDVTSMGSGGTPSSSVPQYFGGGIPWVSIADMTSGGKYISQTHKTLSEDGLHASAAKLYEPDVVLYAMYASLGECSISVGRVTSSQAILGIKPGAKLDSEFLYYFLQSIKSRVKTMGQQGTQSNLNAGMVRNFQIPLPRPAVQRKIAKVLADVDLLISSAERLIAKKQAVKQGMMQQLFGGKTRLPGFSQEWASGPIGGLYIQHRNPVDPRKSRATVFQHFSLPAFDAGQSPVLESGLQIDSIKFSVPSDAILISKLNPRIPRIWAPAHITDKAIASTEFVVAVPSDGVDRSFLAYLFQSPAIASQMKLLAVGTTGSHARIRPNQVASLLTRWPALAEQVAVRRLLADSDAEIAALERQLESTRNIKQGMMQELLTGRTRLAPVEATA